MPDRISISICFANGGQKVGVARNYFDDIIEFVLGNTNLAQIVIGINFLKPKSLKKRWNKRTGTKKTRKQISTLFMKTRPSSCVTENKKLFQKKVFVVLFLKNKVVVYVRLV
jgi:hypothetical protein